MFNITPGLILAIAIILLVSFPVHEFAHAFVAWRLGDGTAKLFGRLTLNPIAHLDPIGSLVLIVSAMVGIGIGWAKPTPVNPSNLRGGRGRESWVAAAGPVSNLLLAVAGAILYRIFFYVVDAGVVSRIVTDTMGPFIVINLGLCIFNLVPIPPLDGSKVMFALMNPRTVWQVRPALEQYGFLILMVVAIIPIGGTSLLGRIIIPIIQHVFSILVGY